MGDHLAVSLEFYLEKEENLVMAEVQNTPKEVEVKETPAPVGKSFGYEILYNDPNFGELVNHMSHLFDTNNFSKTNGIPSLLYFESKKTDEKFQAFLEACKESNDVITGMPKAQSTLGDKTYDIPLKDIPVIVDAGQRLYQILTTFRLIVGYKEEPADRVEKNLTLEALAEVKSAK